VGLEQIESILRHHIRHRQGQYSGVPTVVLVEGVTDELALTVAAQRSGRNLSAEGVSVVPMNGAHAFGRFLRQLLVEETETNVAGLYDHGEEEVIRAALEGAGYAPIDRGELEAIGFFACVVDLEDELIRAFGEGNLWRLIELEGDRQPWHTFRKQHAWRGRPVDQQFRRFIRSVSPRNSRYVRALVETIDPSQLPRPLRLLLDYIEPGRTRPWPAPSEGPRGDSHDRSLRL
jgi:Overcoming lysogenization defect protein-like, TOPRIM domain